MIPLWLLLLPKVIYNLRVQLTEFNIFDKSLLLLLEVSCEALQKCFLKWYLLFTGQCCSICMYMRLLELTQYNKIEVYLKDKLKRHSLI